MRVRDDESLREKSYSCCALSNLDGALFSMPSRLIFWISIACMMRWMDKSEVRGGWRDIFFPSMSRGRQHVHACMHDDSFITLCL